ncbi:trypsin-like serine protease [Streptomyces sp. NPDC021020]|uniref:trypsin-like serine protease n=1 Tax=Streptomyces sp. NPDC021020 TaxID=3365109 RepID=UPI0037AA8123
MLPARTSTGHRLRRRALPAALAALGALAAGALASAPARADTAPPPAAAAPAKAHADALLKRAIRAREAAATAESAKSATAPAARAAEGATPDAVGPHVIGGTPTGAGDAPWMVQLWYDDDNGTPNTTSDDDAFFCGGSVVSAWKVLTAAHCVQGYDLPDYAVLVTGTNQLPTVDANGVLDLHGGTENFVARAWSHPSFSKATAVDDVGVLTLYQPTNATALPIAATGDTASYAAGTPATLYGWGQTSSTDTDLAQTLKKATLPVTANSACTAAYGSTFVPSVMVCAGTPSAGGDAGTTAGCFGDSGGPLVVAGRIVGVMSWVVDECVTKGSYSVFSRVSALAGTILPRMDDADPTGDGHADLIAVDSGGAGWLYAGQGTGLAARQPWGSFSTTTLLRQADLDGDGAQDLVTRGTDRHLYSTLVGQQPQMIGSGDWTLMASVVLPGDLDGDGDPDLVGTDTSGNAWFYPGNGQGRLGSRTLIGTGWQIYAGAVYGKGDLTGDGLPDVVARDTSGVLWLYPGTGKAPAVWGTRVRVGTGWNIFDAFAAVGDVDGDGHADLLTRDGGGQEYIYHGTGSVASPYLTRVKIGPGWGGYTLFG